MDEKKLMGEIEERTSRLFEAIGEQAKKALKEAVKKKQRERAETVKKAAEHLRTLKAYKDFFKGINKSDGTEALLFELASNKLAFTCFNLLENRLGTNDPAKFRQANQKCEEYIRIVQEGLTNRILAENVPELKEELDRKFRELGPMQKRLNEEMEKFAKERGITAIFFIPRTTARFAS